jgi:hypothetical protein
LALSLFHLAEALAAQSKYAEAIPLLEQSAAIKETLLGPKHHDVALVLDLCRRMITASPAATTYGTPKKNLTTDEHGLTQINRE